MRRPHKMASNRIIRKVLTITLALLGIAFILWLNSWFTAYVDLSKFNENLSVGLLLLIGFLTGFHCVGMCGPLILSYATKNARAGHQSHVAHFLWHRQNRFLYHDRRLVRRVWFHRGVYAVDSGRSGRGGRHFFDSVRLAHAASVSLRRL